MSKFVKQVIIMQGVPGSGKSTLAENMRGNLPIKYSSVVVSADMFFTRGDAYAFDATKIGVAHGSCLREFVSAIDDGIDMVIVDNTNTTAIEIAPYYALSEAYGYLVKILRVECDPAVAAARNRHSVPMETVMRLHGNIVREIMPNRWNLEIVKRKESA